MRIFVWTGLMVLCSITANAQIYKWVDENGKTQYTDQPPPTAVKEEQRLQIKSAPMTGSHESGKSRNLTEERLEFDKRQQQKKKKKPNSKLKPKKTKRNVLTPRATENIHRSPRLTVPDGAGGITYVDDETRRKKLPKPIKQLQNFANN